MLFTPLLGFRAPPAGFSHYLLSSVLIFLLSCLLSFVFVSVLLPHVPQFIVWLSSSLTFVDCYQSWC